MKSSCGFTIFEVLISIFILVSSIYVLTNLHLRTLFRIVKDREILERIYLLKKEAYLSFISPPKDDKTKKINIEKPDFSIVLEIVEIGRKSQFFPMNEHINIVKCVGRWIGRNGNELTQYMPFFVRKEKEDEDKENNKS